MHTTEQDFWKIQVFPEPWPEGLVAERARIGLDTHDEVWDGEYHVVPPPNEAHAQMQLDLTILLRPIADALGMTALHERGVRPAWITEWRDYRVADVAVYRRHPGAEAAVSQPTLLIEVRSPRDESFEKLPLYEAVGCEEYVVVDRDTKAIWRWYNDGTSLVEVDGDQDGWHHLRSLPVSLQTRVGRLVVRTETGEHLI